MFNQADTAATGLATTLQLDRDAVPAGGAKLAGTLTRSGAVVTLTLGAVQSGSVTTSLGNGTLAWTPSATARDTIGFPALTTPANESGAADVDY